MNRYVMAASALVLAACHPHEESPDARNAVAQQAAATSEVAGAASARAFVQRFYDWYLATEARHGSAYDSLLTTRRGLLADSLLKVFAADVAHQRADTVAEIASLSAEADVFLNSQDPCPRYTAQAPRAIAGDTLAVPIAGSCGGLDAHPNIEVYVAPRGATWQILTLRDPSDPSFDLLTAFSRYHAESEHAPAPDSADAGAAHGGTA